MSIRRMNESFDKKFKEEYAPVEEIKEGYELLDGTKVELYKDYNKASARAKELGLKEAEYGDAYGVSYCMWNTSGDRNEDEEVIAYYKFEGRKPRPLTDDEAERIARDIGVQFEDFDESLKEANEPDLTPKERREFITKMTTALMGDKFGYSRAEANDIAIKRADALGSNWRVRWGGNIDKEIKQELENTMSKVGYRAIHGIMADESKLKEAFSQSDIDYLKSHKGEKLKKGKYSVEYNEYVDANTNEPTGGSFTLYTNAGRYGKDRTSFKDADELIKYINRHFSVNEGKLNESWEDTFNDLCDEARKLLDQGYCLMDACRIPVDNLFKTEIIALGLHYGVINYGDKYVDYDEVLDDMYEELTNDIMDAVEDYADTNKPELQERKNTSPKGKESAKVRDLIDVIDAPQGLAKKNGYKLFPDKLSINGGGQFNVTKTQYDRLKELGYGKANESLKESKNSYDADKLQNMLSNATKDKLAKANIDTSSLEVSINSPFAKEAHIGYNKDVANYQKAKSGEWVIHGGHSKFPDSLAKSVLNDVCRSLNKYTNESLKEGHTWGDTTIEDYIEKNFSGDDESKQKLIDWFVSLDYTNQFGFKDISVKDIFKKANEFGLSRKYSAIESISESQSQEIAYYYRQLKDKNGFDVARLADAFYKTPEWKEIGFQGDVLFTEKGWNAFKKWAKEKKNIEIKDLGSSDDFLGEGRLAEKKWRHTLENGNALRDAIESEDILGILATLQLCYQELNEVGLIDEDDCDRWIQDIDDIDIEDAAYDDIDWELDQFYDLCDNIGVWIPLNEDTVKQGSQWVNKGKEGTHGKFKTKKEADAQRKAMYANGYKESKKIPTKKGIKEDFATKIDWDDLAFNLDAQLGDVEVFIDEQSYGFAKFEIEFADGFEIKGNLIGNPQRITVGVPAYKTKKTCYYVEEIADFILSLKDKG